MEKRHKIIIGICMMVLLVGCADEYITYHNVESDEDCEYLCKVNQGREGYSKVYTTYDKRCGCVAYN